METYYFRRYRRAGPRQTTGTVIDEVKIAAECATDAEAGIRRKFGSGIAGAMDWAKDFARLEDEDGHVIAERLREFSHA
jgi:hypothetical protein